MENKHIQLFLKNQGYYNGNIDGVFGVMTKTAIKNYTKDYNNDLIGHDLIRSFFSTKGKDMYTLVSDKDFQFLIPSENLNSSPVDIEIPAYEDLNAVYGRVSKNSPIDPSKLVLVNVPYPLRLSWALDQKAKRIKCHKMVSDDILNILNETLDHYGIENVKRLGLDVYGGCYNHRVMRGGSKMSTHSWGIAFDFDPRNNKLHSSFNESNFSKPEYKFWLDTWSKYGFINLGVEMNRDSMHFQKCKR